MNWSNKKVWLVLAGIIILAFAVILVLMVSGPDVKPPQEITATVTTNDGQWTETVQPKYEEFQPNGDDCPPVCYHANIVISIGP